jgi:hypothetical protein
MSPRSVELARRLRLAIGRNRRHIDGRVREGVAEVGRLRSWTTYARWLPGSAMAGAFGLGLALSAGLAGKRMTRWLGMRLMRGAWSHLKGSLMDELVRLWRRSGEGGRS